MNSNSPGSYSLRICIVHSFYTQQKTGMAWTKPKDLVYSNYISLWDLFFWIITDQYKKCLLTFMQREILPVSDREVIGFRGISFNTLNQSNKIFVYIRSPKNRHSHLYGFFSKVSLQNFWNIEGNILNYGWIITFINHFSANLLILMCKIIFNLFISLVVLLSHSLMWFCNKRGSAETFNEYLIWLHMNM